MGRDTDALIRQLATGTVPVRPLAAPWVRAGLWLAIAGPTVALMALLIHPRSDLSSKLSTPRYLSEEAFALTTAILASAAAFASVVPGYGRRFLLLPIVPLALWFASLTRGDVRAWLELGSRGFSFELEWFCLPAIAMVGAVPAIAMTIMLRRGAPLTPRVTAALGGLAAAGLGNVGLCLSHREFSGVLVLVWHVSAVLFLSALAGCTGRYFLNWHSLVAASRRDAPL
jgi:hypothetical protein